MASEWFVQIEGKVCGPFNAGYLKQCAQENRITPETLIRKDADGQWVAAGQVRGLFDGPPSTPPAAPDDFAPVEVASVSVDNPYRSPQQPNVIYCERCGQSNEEYLSQCKRCGNPLYNPRQTQYASDNTLGGLIPYKNSHALWAYYLGIFSLFACIPLIGFFIGLPLGIAALVFGLKGRRYAVEHPEAKGGVHAWVGIILGVLSLISTTLFLVFFLISLLAHK